MRAVAVIAFALVAGCDIPTELPKWNPTFAVPLGGTSVAVAQLVPISVENGVDGSTFVISPPSLAFPHSLAKVCVSCAHLDGRIANVPQLQYTDSFRVPLPASVDSAAVVLGAIDFRVTNGWSFDPLRPAPGQTGSMRLDVIGRDGQVRGFALFSGRDRSFAPGTVITGTITFAGAATQTPNLRLSLVSPASEPVHIDTAAALTVSILSGRLVATEATVNVVSRQVTSLPMQLNLAGVDDFIIRRVRGGKLVLTIENDFSVSGRMTLNITGGLNLVTKTFDIPNTDATVEVALSEADLESILGRSVVASIQGLVSTLGSVILMPTSAFRVAPLLVLELGPDS